MAFGLFGSRVKEGSCEMRTQPLKCCGFATVFLPAAAAINPPTEYMDWGNNKWYINQRNPSILCGGGGQPPFC